MLIVCIFIPFYNHLSVLLLGAFASLFNASTYCCWFVRILWYIIS